MKIRITSAFLSVIAILCLIAPTATSADDYSDMIVEFATIDGISYSFNYSATVEQLCIPGDTVIIPEKVLYKGTYYEVKKMNTAQSTGHDESQLNWDYCTNCAQYKLIVCPPTMTSVNVIGLNYAGDITLVVPNKVKLNNTEYLTNTSLKIRYYGGNKAPEINLSYNKNVYWSNLDNANMYATAFVDGVGYILDEQTAQASVIHADVKGDAFSVPQSVLYKEKNYTVTEFLTQYDNNFTFDNSRYKSIVIPKTVKKVDSSALVTRDKAVNISIPESVESITGYENTLYYCNRVNGVFFMNRIYRYSLTVDENNAFYKTADNCLFSKDGKILYKYFGGETDKFTVPDGVEKICDFAFSFVKINDVVLPKTLKTIGKYAFFATGLARAIIPENVTEIGDFAFGYEIYQGIATKPNVGYIIYSASPVATAYAKANGIWASSAAVSGCMHGYIFEITKQPTCTKSGERTYTCKYCNEVKKTTIAALGHKISRIGQKAATYFAKGKTGVKKCVNCGKIFENSKETPKLKLATPKITLSSKSKRVTVKYKKVTDAKKYQIDIYCNGYHERSFLKGTSYTCKKLKKGAKCEIKVRAIIFEGKKTAYSNYSKTKHITVK